MTRTCAIDGYRDATCTVDWDGRRVWACNDCAGVTPESPRVAESTHLADVTLVAVRRMLAGTCRAMTTGEMCDALELNVASGSPAYQRVGRALRKAKAEQRRRAA